jgi:gluconate:H+ symporter, GntP family
MAGQPLLQALLLLASVIVLVVVSRRLHPFVAIVVVATAFGLLAGLSAGFVGKAFGVGFSQALYSPGLLIVAAAFVAGIAERTAASDWLTARIQRWRWLGRKRLAALAGLVCGVAASPASAFILLTPLLRAAAAKDGAVALTLALAISASHGLLLMSPVAIAAVSILDADAGRTVLFGLPLAIVLAAFGAVWARWLPAAAAAGSPPPQQASPPGDKRGGWSALVLLAATALPLLLLMVRSIGDFPSEPLGGGPSREMVLGLGRPLTLSWLAAGIMFLGLWRPSGKLLADSSWTARVLGDAAGILLIVGAAGGLQRLCQETGMAELVGERLASWPGGVLVPFLIAAAIKSLQGSSLVAAIAAAGMVQPLLAGLGLGGESARALAALAIGAGAMTISHVNDEYFWLVGNSAGLSPLRGLMRFSMATLLQGIIAAAALLALSALFRGI